MPQLRTRLKYWRTVRGLGQDELAAKAKCSKSTIVKIEKSGNPPQPLVIRRLAAALGITTEQLFVLTEVEADNADGRKRGARIVAA